jgi:serine/threonine protein kinase
MIRNGPWDEKWIAIAPLDGGGQGDTIIVRSATDETARAVLKLLKAHKTTDSKARRRMAQEVLNLKLLHSAGGKVPKVLDGNTEKFADQNSSLYFVMEFIEGNTLANVIKTGPLSLTTSVHIALDLCSTVRVAVKEGISHRDIKPENIIIRGLEPPDAVMVDFGLSFNEEDSAGITDTEEALDNKFLSLPERRGPGENKRDFRSDLTGICGILFYCLTQCLPRNLRDSKGRPPHRWPDYLLDKFVQDQKQLSFLNAFLDRGLSYELDQRFQTVDELSKRLDEILAPATIQPIEDLEAVVATEDAALRKNDRKTQLAEFFKIASRLQNPILTHMGILQQKLSKYNRFDLMWGRFVNPVQGKFDGGDLLSAGSFIVSVQNHPINHEITYKIVAHGLECVVYREVSEQTTSGPSIPIGLRMSMPQGAFVAPGPNSPGKLVQPPSAILRYKGDIEPNVAIIISDIERAITESIKAISKKIQGGY